MATYATLTINAADIIGENFDRSRASVWVEANTEHGLIVVDGTSVRVGGRRENLVDGVATFELVTTNSADNPTSFGYRVTIVYVPKGSRKQGHDQITTSDFPLTASANLAAIPEAWDNVTIPPSWRSDFKAELEAIRAEAEAARDEAVDLSGISTSDAVIASRIATPGTATQAALSATYEAAGPSGGAADDTAALQAGINAAVAAGRALRLRRGATYLVSATITVPSNAVIEGNGATIQAKPGTNAHVIANADPATGNSKITIRDLRVDANRANQTAEVNALHFVRVTYSLFDNVEGRGGRRNNLFPNGTNGEGLCLVLSDHNEVRGGYFHDNDYDGIKLRGSDYNRIHGATCENNGRSGIQLAFFDPDETAPFNGSEGVFDAGSNYNEVSNLTIRHATGTPSAAAPTTSGIYLHTASFNTFASCTVYGAQQGIGLAQGCNDNAFASIVVRNRFTTKASVELEAGAAPCHRNTFVGIIVRGLSGNNGRLLHLWNASYLNRFAGCYFSKGDGTGTWTAVLESDTKNTSLVGSYIDATLTDSGTANTLDVFDFAGNHHMGKLSSGLISSSSTRVTFLPNSTMDAGIIPSGGGLLYVEAGALKFKGSSGTVTTLGPA